MKIIILIFLTLLFLTGCSTLNLQNKISSKEEFVNKANKGDIKAMIALSKYYKFPQTKEGFDFYNSWYKTIEKENNVEDILEFANIFTKYNDMFINGEQKSEALYNIAIEKGSKEALFLQIEKHIGIYEREKRDQIEKKILENATQEDFIKLYSLYKKNYKTQEAKRIKELILTKGFPYKQTFKNRLEEIIYKKNKKEEINKILDEIIATNNSKEIFKIAIYLKKRYKFIDALKLYNAGFLLDTTNNNAYYEVSQIYNKGSFKENLKQDKAKSLEYLKKAANNNHIKASIDLLREYTKDQNHIDEYFNLVKKLKQTNDGKIALAEYYYSNNKKAKANEILEKLAKKGDEEAILNLALRIPSNYKFNPEEFNLTKKWQKYIFESNNISLKNQFEEKLISSDYFYNNYYYEIIEKKAFEKKDIILLRKLYNHNKYQREELSFKYLQEATKYGDVKSSLILAKEYLKSKEDTNIYKGLSIYEKLSQKDDIKATKELARFYRNPPYEKEKFKDYKKSIEYYEKASNLGDIQSIRKLLELFLCGECESKKFIDNKKAKFYLEKLIKSNNKRDLYNIGWLYNFKEKDLLKAKEYYEKAGELGYSIAYYNLAWLYYKNKAIEINYKKALEYLKKGVELNDTDSINLLGLFYEKGYGVEKDIKTAVSYYKKIANFDKYASHNLARYYKSKKDYVNAFKYYKIGSSYGHSNAMYELGIFYEKGLGVKKDISKALKSYKDAYNYYNHKLAAYNIGLIYHYAKGGIKQDLKLAEKWYKKSTIEDAKIQLKKLK